jgi:hypothetical protein
MGGWRKSFWISDGINMLFSREADPAPGKTVCRVPAAEPSASGPSLRLSALRCASRTRLRVAAKQIRGTKQILHAAQQAAKKKFPVRAGRASPVLPGSLRTISSGDRHAFPHSCRHPFDKRASRRKIGPSDRLEANRFDVAVQ